MSLFRTTALLLAAGWLALALLPAADGADDADDPKKDKKKDKVKKGEGVWTDPDDPSLPVDFKYQGEYAADKIGCQVIALDKGRFQAVVYPGGLPGDGWDGKNKILMDGKLDGDKVVFEPTKGKRDYKAKGFEKFSATSKFPPVGQTDYSATLSDGALSISTDDGKSLVLRKVKRASKTLGKKPPRDAIVLFDGTSKDEWKGGRLDEKTKVLNTDGGNVRSKRNFTNFTAHIEFMTPYRPAARDQERGNSGFYMVDTYEVQVLDSFGLDGKRNECGGIYKWRDSPINMCYPPLTWQTYDVDFSNAEVKDGKVVKKARITVRHNGVVIHDDFELPGPNGGGRDDEGKPGPIKLQGHGNPVQYRNIWVVEKK